MGKNLVLAIDTQLDQINFLGTDLGKSLWDGLVRQQVGVKLGMDSRQVYVEALSYSPSYYVENDMTEFIQHAAYELEKDHICPSISETDLLTNMGFAYFERPLSYVTWVAGEEEPVKVYLRALSWGVTGGVLVKDPYQDKLKPTDGLFMGVFFDTKHVPEAQAFKNKGFPVPSVVIVDETAWSFMIPWSELTWEEYWEDPNISVGTGTVNPEHASFRRLIYSFFHLISARIYTVKLPRAARRRAERQLANPPPHYGDIRVVTLRRSTTRASAVPEGLTEEEGREWSHRWMVSGHWRNQWYKREQVHRPIWIEPYVKGPEDKPLVIKDTLYDVKR